VFGDESERRKGGGSLFPLLPMPTVDTVARAGWGGGGAVSEPVWSNPHRILLDKKAGIDAKS